MEAKPTDKNVLIARCTEIFANNPIKLGKVKFIRKSKVSFLSSHQVGSMEEFDENYQISFLLFLDDFSM